MSADPLIAPFASLARGPGPAARASEQELVARALRGDLDAYGALVERHEAVCFRTALLIARSRQDAEDAVQDAFVKAFRALRTFRPDAAFRPWLLRIVSNEAYERGRGRRRDLLLRRRSHERFVPGHEPGVDELALRGEEAARVLRAVAQLEERDRLAIILRYFVDLPDREAAEVLRVSPEALRVRIFRALARLRTLLEADADD